MVIFRTEYLLNVHIYKSGSNHALYKNRFPVSLIPGDRGRQAGQKG